MGFYDCMKNACDKINGWIAAAFNGELIETNTAFNKNFGTAEDEVARGDHNHDDAYYLKSEIDNKVKEKADINHNHNDIYYQKSECDINYHPKGGDTALSIVAKEAVEGNEVVTKSQINLFNNSGIITDSNEKIVLERTLPTFKRVVNNGEFLFELIRDSGNVVQGFAYDKFTGDGFASQVVSGKLVITKYTNISANFNKYYPTYTIELDIDSHQALGLFYHDNKQWLAMNYSSDGAIVLFRIDSSGLLEQKLVNVYGTNSGYCTVGVSDCMNYLCIEGVESDGVNYVKLYDINTVMNNDNIENLYITKFALPDRSSPPYPLQGLAMDKQNIYIAYGDGDKSCENFIEIYSLDGVLKDKITLTVGADDTDKYEQEGIFWAYLYGHPILCTTVATGADGANTIKIYSLDGENIYRHKTKSINLTNPDSIYLLDGSKVFNDDTISLDRMYIKFFRYETL